MEFIELINKRHSIREYSEEPVSIENLNKLVECAKLAPSSRNKKPCDFIVVTDKEILSKLAEAKAAGSQMLKKAGGAIIVTGDSSKSDVWVEDCSIAMTYLHLAAVNLGYGSCWIQIRKRETADRTDSGEYIKKMFGLKDGVEVLAVLSLGMIKS